MEIKCLNCKNIFEANQSQEWTVNKVIENKLLDVPLVCNLCGQIFTIDPKRIFDFKIDFIKQQREERKESIFLGSDKVKVGPQKGELARVKRYRSEALSLMRINDVVVSKTKSISDFEYSLVGVNNKFVEIDVKVMNSNLDYGLEELNKYQSVLNKINTPKDNLILRIDNQGSIVDVINREEIEKNWEKVKEELENDKLFKQFNTIDKKKIFETADMEYYNLSDFSKIANKGYSVYAMLFPGFWGDYTVKTTKNLQSRSKQSLLFKDVEVPIEFEAKLKRLDQEMLIAQIEIQGIESDSFNSKNLDALYKESFPFAKNQLDKYRYDILANYEFDAFRGNISTFNMTVIEEAGDVEMFMDCKIKTLNDEESHFTE